MPREKICKTCGTSMEVAHHSVEGECHHCGDSYLGTLPTGKAGASEEKLIRMINTLNTLNECSQAFERMLVHGENYEGEFQKYKDLSAGTMSQHEEFSKLRQV